MGNSAFSARPAGWAWMDRFAATLAHRVTLDVTVVEYATALAREIREGIVRRGLALDVERSAETLTLPLPQSGGLASVIRALNVAVGPTEVVASTRTIVPRNAATARRVAVLFEQAAAQVLSSGAVLEGTDVSKPRARNAGSWRTRRRGGPVLGAARRDAQWILDVWEAWVDAGNAAVRTRT